MCNKEREEKIKYFETHGLQYQLHHLQMRSTGLQVFTAIQGGLLVGWAMNNHPALILLGLGSTLSFLLWDTRNRFIFKILRRFGEKYVDSEIFGTDENGKPKDGINKILRSTIEGSGKLFPGKHFASHTWAIRVLIIITFFIWSGIILNSYIIPNI